MLYHVSKNGGIQVLSPQVSSHGMAYVYAIENLTTALLFGARSDDFDFLIDENDLGIPELYECYPGAFNAIYNGKSCFVYEVEETGFIRGQTGWAPELVCPTEVVVSRETFVPDLYSRLLNEAKCGNLSICYYEDKPEYKALISAHLVDRMIRFDALDRFETDIRFQTHYRNLVLALRSAMDGHLLR